MKILLMLKIGVYLYLVSICKECDIYYLLRGLNLDYNVMLVFVYLCG